MFRPSRWLVPACALACALAARPAAATISPEAKAIVDRYVEATGGRDALESERALHAKGRLNTIQLRGGFERWSQAPDRMVERISLGTLRVQQGYDGTTGWRLDVTSKSVTVLAGKELERIRGDAYFASEMWARDGQGGGNVTLGPTGFRAGEDYRSIVVTPPAGTPRKLWFSARTGLLTRAVLQSDRGSSDTWLADYRAIAGRRRPGVESAYDPEMHLTLDPHADTGTEQALLDSVWANPAVDSTRFSPPALRDASLAWAKARGVAAVPFRYGGSHVWVRASLDGGPPADFIVDTGASLSVIDRGYAEEIGLGHEGAAGVQGMGGGGSLSFSRVASLRIGEAGDGVTLRDLRVGLVDLSAAGGPLAWRRICGLIGYDVLSRFVVEIDYDRRIVTFRDPRAFVYRGNGRPVDITLSRGVPVVRVKLDDQCEGDFIVDVGNAAGVILHGSLVRRCRLFDDVKGHKQLTLYSGGIGAGFVNWVTRIDSLTIGPYAVTKPIVGLALGTHGMVGSQEIAGNIGSNLLEQFTCTFDYGHRKLYLEPGRSFGTPGHFSRAGSYLLRFPHRVVVGGILRGSAAEDAGLKVEDEVTLIDHRPALDYSPEDMDRLFVDGEPGTTHTLTILRDGRTKTVTMTLKDAL